MANTVVGVYDDYSQAEKARDELIQNGFPSSVVQLSPAAHSPDARRALLRDTEQADSPAQQDPAQQGWSIGGFVSMMFGNDTKDEHVDIYSEAIRRGSYLLSVDADDDQEGLKAADIMNRHDPVDIDERASQWRREGWSRHDDGAPASGQHDAAPESSQRTAAPAAGSSRVRTIPRANLAAQRGASGINPESILEGTAVWADDSATDDSDLRTHWQTTYGSQGSKYEDYVPAYHYGRKLAGNEKYRGYRWSDIAAEVRQSWEADNKDSPWERIEKAVRYGWEKWGE